MTTREKIIVGLAVLAVAYGAVELFLPRVTSAPPKLAQTSEGLNAFIAKVAEAAKPGIDNTSAAILEKAKAEWRQNPFLKIQKPPPPSVPTSEKKTPEKNVARLAYSGYLDMNGRRLAIINGLEYEVGDRVEPDGLTIKSILPNKVIMVYTKKEGNPIVLPLQDSE